MTNGKHFRNGRYPTLLIKSSYFGHGHNRSSCCIDPVFSKCQTLFSGKNNIPNTNYLLYTLFGNNISTLIFMQISCMSNLILWQTNYYHFNRSIYYYYKHTFEIILKVTYTIIIIWIIDILYLRNFITRIVL